MYRAQDGRVEPSPAGRSSDFETEPAEQGVCVSNITVSFIIFLVQL